MLQLKCGRDKSVRMKNRVIGFAAISLAVQFFHGPVRGHDVKGIVLELTTSAAPNIASALAVTPTAEFNTRSVLYNLRLWPVPRRLTICFHSGSEALRKRISDSMRRVWALAELTQGRLDFDQASFNSRPDCGENPRSDVRVDFRRQDGHWSYVGAESRLHNRSMNFDRFTETHPDNAEFDRVVGHELGHALGLEHEHQSPGAPNCNWDFEYIWENYDWKTRDDMLANFTRLRNYIQEGKRAYIFSTYDKLSLMHYSFKADAFKDKSADPCFIEQNFSPSDQDKNAIRVAYGPNSIAVQTQTRSLISDVAKAFAAPEYEKLRQLLKAKSDVLNE
jgi:hypothetical protein